MYTESRVSSKSKARSRSDLYLADDSHLESIVAVIAGRHLGDLYLKIKDLFPGAHPSDNNLILGASSPI